MRASCIVNRPSLYTFAFLALAFAFSVPAHAQAEPDLRDGFYASGGAAYGSGSVDVTANSVSSSETPTGISFYLAAGTALSPHWRVGGEWDVLPVSGLFSDEVAGAQSGTLSFFSAAVAYYPSLTKAFWVKGNLGWARLSVSASASGASSESGLGGGIGAGYDYRLGQSEYVLIPFVNYFTQFSHADLNGFLQGQGTGKISLFQIGVGLGYHH